MNPSEFPSTGGGGTPPPSPSKKGPGRSASHPSPLKVSKESHKIKKPPLQPPSSAATVITFQPRRPQLDDTNPRIIHVQNPTDFKELVQRLTGKPVDDTPAGTGDDLSPTTAPRLASIENSFGVEFGPFPGIISPPPTTLPLAAPPGFFPPMNEMAPFSTEFLSASSFLSLPATPSPTASAGFFPPVAEMSPFSTEFLPSSSFLSLPTTPSPTATATAGFLPPMSEMAPFSTEFLPSSSFFSLPTTPSPTATAGFFPPMTEMMTAFSSEFSSASNFWPAPTTPSPTAPAGFFPPTTGTGPFSNELLSPSSTTSLPSASGSVSASTMVSSPPQSPPASPMEKEQEEWFKHFY